ncbi:hypothetical protein WMY93_028156 [Mugilogobius chulae]|uniref:Uncharacterized protein n=1 Tax=Mugilogobius chulae TaxID=88201 RepID=A0AAW0MS56_9GOBI
MNDTPKPPLLHVSVPSDAPVYSDGASTAVSDGCVRSSSSTPTLRRKRFKMRRMRNVPSERDAERARLAKNHLTARSHSGSKEYLQLPSIEITPSSDEDAPSSWSSCSTPSASPRRKRFLLRKWLKQSFLVGVGPSQNEQWIVTPSVLVLEIRTPVKSFIICISSEVDWTQNDERAKDEYGHKSDQIMQLQHSFIRRCPDPQSLKTLEEKRSKRGGD